MRRVPSGQTAVRVKILNASFPSFNSVHSLSALTYLPLSAFSLSTRITTVFQRSLFRIGNFHIFCVASGKLILLLVKYN